MAGSKQRRANWFQKFAVALRGIRIALLGQNSFAIHLPATLAVVLAGWYLRVSRIEWCLLVLSIAIVLAAEIYNTAIEYLAKAITAENRDEVRDALDVASGAVLVVSIGAAIVGLLILGFQLLEVIGPH